MAQPGDVIEHPRGEKIVFRETAAGSGGALLRFEYFARPRLQGPPAHIYIEQEERFEVVSGTAGFRVAGKESILAAGESAVVPAMTGHSFWNAGDDELHMTVELRPAANMEEFFETLFRLGREGAFRRARPQRPAARRTARARAQPVPRRTAATAAEARGRAARGYRPHARLSPALTRPRRWSVPRRRHAVARGCMSKEKRR